MRKIIFAFLIVAGFIACKSSVKGSNGVIYKSPVDYNNYIVTRQTSLIKKVLSFTELAQNNLDSAQEMLRVYESQTDAMINEIKGMPPYKGDSSLRESALKSFSFYKKVFNDDYKRLIEIRKQGGDQTEEGAAEMNRIVEKLSKEEEQLDKAFHNAQQNFADRNKMKLEVNEMQKKIDKMNEE